MKRVSMTDIAKAAGVSHATVARVLNNSGYVAPETRRIIEEKVEELGYIPNQMARALKRQRSGIIGSLFVHNSSGLIHRINQSIDVAAQAHGYELLVMETQHGSEDRAIHSFLSLRADGIVVISDLFVPAQTICRLKNLSVPFVAVERGYAADGVDNLLVRDFDACYDVVRRIAAHGHRCVGLIAAQYGYGSVASSALDVEKQRYDGFLAAAKDFGLDLRPELVGTLQDGYTEAYGYAAMERLLALDDPPTAVFATADQLAAGALQCLYAHGKRVPDDMSVIGYDNVLSAQLSPPLNSVALVYDGIGPAVIAMLTERMTDADRLTVTRYIDTRYIDRGTLRQL